MLYFTNKPTGKEAIKVFAYFIGSGYFAVNSILPWEAILSPNICNWSILITY